VDPEREVDNPTGLVARLRSLVGRNGGDSDSDTAQAGRWGFRARVFGTHAFFRLWLAQAVTSLADWLAFFGILALANRGGAGEVGPGGGAGASIGLVMAARIVPGFFFSAAAGILADRMDRKQVMVATTLLRALVVAALPFVDSVLGLVFASLVLELATLLFSPAKEATVPNLVPQERLASANSLGLVAAYGTFPLGAVLFALLAQVADWLGRVPAFDSLRTSQEAVAFYVACGCLVAAAAVVSGMSIPRERPQQQEDQDIDLGRVFIDLKEGWHFAFLNPVVRGVNLGLATGLMGGGMLVPLGQPFSEQVLGAGPSGFGLFVTALGVGVGAGILLVTLRQNVLVKDRAFVMSAGGAGFALLIGASMSRLGPALLAVAVMGAFAGRVYVLGFTLLHEQVDDDLRGRVFAGLYALVRLCVLISMAIGPLLSGLLDDLSRWAVDRSLGIFGVEVAVPGVRLTLWLAGVIMLLAAVLAGRSMRGGQPSSSQPSPSPG
jgi:MFS family permease